MSTQSVDWISSVAELTQPVYVLSATEAQALADAGKLLEHLSPNTEPELYCRSAKRAGRSLPDSLLDVLQKFSSDGSASGILVVRRADVGPAPSTPPDNSQALGSHTLLARESAVLAEVVGNLVGYEAEAGGSLQQDMVPNRDKQFAQESQGSRVDLEAHTEQCFSQHKPDFVILACIRSDPKAATFAFTARQLMARLAPDEISLLRRKLWTTSIDSSFKPFVPHPDEIRGPLPILSGALDDPALLIDQDLMYGITAEAQGLLRKVITTYETHRNAHVLQRGDILLLDNRRAMHGRSSFQPRFDGGDRFIVRSMAVRDLHRLGDARKGRLIVAERS